MLLENRLLCSYKYQRPHAFFFISPHPQPLSTPVLQLDELRRVLSLYAAIPGSSLLHNLNCFRLQFFSSTDDVLQREEMANQPCYGCGKNGVVCVPGCLIKLHFPPGSEAQWDLVEDVFGYGKVSERLEGRQLHERVTIVGSMLWDARSWVQDGLRGPRAKYNRVKRQRDMFANQLMEIQVAAHAEQEVQAAEAAAAEDGPAEAPQAVAAAAEDGPVEAPQAVAAAAEEGPLEAPLGNGWHNAEE